MASTKKPALGTGQRFSKLSGSVAKEYMAKGKTASEARRIGAAIAAKAGRKAHSPSVMTKLAVAGKKRAQ